MEKSQNPPTDDGIDPAGVVTGLSVSVGPIPGVGNHLLFANREVSAAQVNDADLDRCRFVNFGLKQAIFNQGRLRHCSFERSYLRHAKFKAVDLTGTSFANCNLKYVSFDGCKLDYVTFANCQLDYDNILENLPAQPNLQRHLLRSIRLNAATQADPQEITILLREMAAERAELSATFRGANEYFRSRPGRERWRAFRRWCGHQFQSNVWGYGLRLRVLLRSACFMIALGVGSVVLGRMPFRTPGEATPRPLTIGEAIFLSTTSFTTIGAGDISPAETGGRTVVALESLAGAAFLGLLAATAYRKIAR